MPPPSPNASPSDETTRPDTSYRIPQGTIRQPSLEQRAQSVTPWLLLLVIIALAGRLLMFQLGPVSDIERAFYPDSHRYIELAENMVNQGTFGLAEETSGVVHVPLAKLRSDLGQLEPKFANGLQPEVFRTPGYPAVIGAIAWSGLPRHSLLLLQCILSATGVLLVYGIGRAVLSSQRAALFASLIVALHPADIMSANAILSETLFTTLMLLGIYFVAAKPSHTPGGLKRGALGGLFLGLSVLVRPISILVGPAIAVWMVVTDRRLKTLGAAALLTLVSILPGALWAMRNHHVGFGLNISNVPSVNGLFYTVNYMRLTQEGREISQGNWAQTAALQHSNLRDSLHDGEDVFAGMRRLTGEAIAADVGTYLSVLRRSAFKFFTDHSLGGMYSQLGLTYQPSGLAAKIRAADWSLPASADVTGLLLALVWFSFNALLLLGTIIGLLLMVWRRQWKRLLLLGGVLFYFVLATQGNGLERFRLPVLGIEALIVASMFTVAPPRPAKKKRRKKTMANRFDKDVEKQEPVSPPRPSTTGRPI